MVLLSEVLDTAQRVHGSQAGVGRAVVRTRATANAWYTGRSIPDYEACLQLAAITGYSAEDVLRAAGHDPSLVSAPVHPRAQPELQARLARVADTLSQYPPAVWRPVLEANERMVEALAAQQPTNGRRDTSDNGRTVVVVEMQPTPRHRGTRRTKEAANKAFVLGWHPLRGRMERRAAAS